MLLDPELRARLERLALVARGRVRAQWSGRHASAHKGESLDFADYREYVPGDDFRRIDHNLWARLGQVLIRQYEAEEELPVRLLLDVSRSMDFHHKLPTARVLAAMIAYLALSGGDRVLPSVVPGQDGRLLSHGPAGRHLAAWPSIELWLESVPPGGTAPLATALRTLVGAGPGRGAVVLISDLMDGEWERALDGAVGAAGGLVLHVLAPSELDPAGWSGDAAAANDGEAAGRLVGDLRLVDAEHGGEVEVSTSPETLRRYRETLESFVEGAAARARRAGLDYLLVPAGPAAADQALRALTLAEVVK